MAILGYDGIKALIKLLETEGDAYGPVLKDALAVAIKQNPDQVERVMQEEFHSSAPRTVVHALEEICWEDLSKALARYCNKINPDLEEGLTLLAKFTSPTTARGNISAPLDRMAQDLRPALLNAANYGEIAAIFGHYIFNVSQFSALSASADVKDMSFSRFLAKKRGSGLCMACLYAALGQRFGLDVNLIDLAGRILVNLQNPATGEALFIDPLDNGKVLSERDCRQYIELRQLSWHDFFLTPLSSHLIIRRFIANMIYALNKLRDERRLKFLRGYLDIIKG